MTPEEQKKAEETAAAEAAAKAEKEQADAEFEASLEGLSDEEKEQKKAERNAQNPDNQPDLAQRLKEEKERREAAEKALADKRFKDAERRRKAKESGGDPDEDEPTKPITAQDLEDRLAEERQTAEKLSNAGRIKEIATKISEGATEAELTIEIHKNRTWPSSIPLEEQIAEAHAIATRKKVIAKTSELTRALKSKQNASKDAGGAHHDGLPPKTPAIASDIESSLKRQKFEYDTASKAWKKKLPNGKFLYKQVIGSKVTNTWTK